MPGKYTRLLLLLTLLHLSKGIDAQPAKKIALRGSKIALNNNVARWIDSTSKEQKEPQLVVLQFRELPTTAQRNALQQQGINLLEYLPGNVFTALVKTDKPANNSALTSVTGITSYKTEWKADNYTWKKVAAAKNTIELLVTFYSNISATAARQFIAETGGQINSSPTEQHNLYKVIIAADKVRGMASWYGVQNISPVTGMVPYDLQSRPAVKANMATWPATLGGYGLNGDSVTVGVGDNASGIYHADLKDRVENFNPGPMASHGEHVNGIVGGAGTVDPLGIGTAPGTRLLDYMFDQVIPATGPMLHDHNMTITNNSYGVLLGDCDYSGTYDGYSRYLDTLSLMYPEVLHVFASGNDGWMSCLPYPTSYATVGGGYQISKNALVTGSMTDYLSPAPDESRGPTRDGRMKPEMVAVGLGAYSTIGIDNYTWAAGTSMAAPQVSGGLALLTQHYKHLHGGTSPAADILKAITLNGTMDLGTPGPDFSYGFGAMDLYRSLQMLDNNAYYTGTINNSETQNVTITVPAGTAQIKVMLYWHDKPANTAATTQLVNDLDLAVIDPSATVRLPLVCDPTPANVTAPATEREDHLNTAEQVTINNPTAGTYTIRVKGYNVPFAAQRYVVAYDIIPTGTRLTYPLGGEQLSNVDSIRVFWNTASTDSTFKVEFSSNNGSSWTTLAAALPGTARYCPMMPAGINSGNCRVRVTKNGTGETQTSGRFAISDTMTRALDTAQCPGYVNIHWKPVPNATAYELLAKKGNYLQVVGTTSDTTYSFVGMSTTEKSYVAVQPIINGIRGYRSKALIRIANTGTCSHPSSTGDLAIDFVTTSRSGRKHTSGELTDNESFSLRLRNRYALPCSNFIVVYSMNGSAWDTIETAPTIGAHSIGGAAVTPIDLSAPGTYNFTAAIVNLAVPDPNPANDTLRFTIQNIPNDTLTLPYEEGFEDIGKLTISGRDSINIAPNGHWDFNTNDTNGRVRSYVREDAVITGNRSISMDEVMNVATGSGNQLWGTFNLGAYDTATTEVRLDFDYVLHGAPKSASGNEVSFRANDAMPWLPVFSYNLNAYPGSLNKALSVSLTDAARAQNRNFSSSMQLSFGQNDTSLIGANNYGNGLTLDNVKLYTVANDAQLVQVVSPLPTNCGLAAAQPLTVRLHNGVNYTLHNVTVYYAQDGGTVYSETIDTIAAKATIDHTFAQLLDMPAGTSHKLNVWLVTAGDTYQPNDSIINYKFRNSKVITDYPYLEDFEANDGGYYTDGINNSWAYGVPSAPQINKAASGVKAWKTNLSGRYNNLEVSYLYSPCFDISGMNAPTLSFSTALDIEDCGSVLCDQAYVEYTYNGTTWYKLGNFNSGTNWYDQTFNAWTHNGFTRWHVATSAIPKPAGSGSVINFRFVLASDPGANFEGIAVDDIHIYDMAYPILPVQGTSVSANITGSVWTYLLQGNNVVSSVNANGLSIGNTTFNLHPQSELSNPTLTQAVAPRSYVASTAHTPADSISLRLYITDSEFVVMTGDTGCHSCTTPGDVYRLGITAFNSDTRPSSENNTLTDDSAGQFTFTPYNKTKWVPYEKGYYAEFKTKSIGEYWFNDGGPTHNFAAGKDYLNFTAYASGLNVQVLWTSLIDTAVNTYVVERSVDGANFSDILTVTATHSNPGIYRNSDFIGMLSSTNIYYRLRWTITGSNKVYYSPIRKINTDDPTKDIVLFDARMIAANAVLADWTSYIDGVIDHYKLERAIGNSSFSTLDIVFPLRHYGQYYSYTDVPGDITPGTIVHYKLTATLDNGTDVVLPEKIVEWMGANTVGNVYPNPCTDGTLYINWFAPSGTTLTADLMDMQGRTWHLGDAQATQWGNTTQLQTSMRAAGMYLLRCTVGNKQYTSKVVFER